MSADEFGVEGPVTAGALQALTTATIAQEAWADGDALIYSSADGKLHPVPVAPLAGAVVSVNATSPLASSGGVAPIISLAGVVAVNKGGTGSATGDAGSLINLPAAQLSGDVPLVNLATSLTAGGGPIKGTVLTATTRIDSPTIGTGSGTQHALPSGTADILTADSTATVTGKSIDAGQLTGSIADARLSANVALLSGAQSFTGQKTFPGAGASAIVLPAVRQASGGFDITMPTASGADIFALLAQVQTFTNKSISGSANTLTNIGNSALTNSSVTVTASTGLTGGGAVALGASVSLSIDSTVATLTGSQVLTNKSIDGGTNTLTSLPAAALTGSISDARLSANVALLTGAQTVTGQKTYPGAGTSAIVLPAVRQASGGFDITVPVASGADSFALLGQTQTLTNKTISGASNTLSSIGNGSLTNSSLTVTASTGLSGGGAVSLGGSVSLSLSTVVPSLGGTGLTTLTAHGVLLGQGASNVVVAPAGTAGQVFTSGGGSADGAYADPVGAANGSATLTSTYALTQANGTYEDIGCQVTLPSAGTYLVIADLRSQLSVASGAGANIEMKLYNATAGADITSSERIGAFAGAVNVTYVAVTTISMLITVAVSSVIKVYASRNTGTSYTLSQITTDSAGRSRMLYAKLNYA